MRVCCVPDAAFTFSYAGVARVMAHALMLMLMSIHVYTILDAVIPIRGR